MPKLVDLPPEVCMLENVTVSVTKSFFTTLKFAFAGNQLVDQLQNYPTFLIPQI